MWEPPSKCTPEAIFTSCMSTHVCPGKKERVGGGGGMALHCLNTAKKIWQVALVQEPSRAASAAEPPTHSVVTATET